MSVFVVSSSLFLVTIRTLDRDDVLIAKGGGARKSERASLDGVLVERAPDVNDAVPGRR